nr:MAG TPA: hypothetical protein [Caudoviricetes sp.]
MKLTLKQKFFGDFIEFLKANKKKDTVDLGKYEGSDKAFIMDFAQFLYMTKLFHSFKKGKVGSANADSLSFENEKRYFENMKVNSWYDFAFFMKERREKSYDALWNKTVADMECATHMGLFKGFYEDFMVFYKKYPTSWLIDFMNNHKALNLDGTYFYFIEELEEVTVIIALNTWIRRMSEDNKFLFELIDEKTAEPEFVDAFKKVLRNYVTNGLPEGYSSPFMMLHMEKERCQLNYNPYMFLSLDEMRFPLNSTNLNNILMRPFRTYLTHVPPEDIFTRPKEFINKIKEIEANDTAGA